MTVEQSRESVAIQRSLLYEILAVSILVAFGVNLLASIAFDHFRAHERTLTTVGIACIVLSVGYLSSKAYLRLNTSSEFEGVFLVGEKNEPISIPRYDFSEDLTRFIHGLCAENPAIEKLWQTPFAGSRAKNGIQEGTHDPQSRQLLVEAIEYFFLNELSLHLSGHFENNERISEDELISVSAADIPGVLLKNRCLSTFSRSMEERVPFMDRGEDPQDGEVIFMMTKNGAMFHQFELILPRGTKVERTGTGSLHIVTPRFTLAVAASFGGFSAFIDNELAAFYIKRTPHTFGSYIVKLNLSIRLNPLAMLSRKGWEYYRWRETFIGRLENAFSFERFKERVGWETARTIAILRDPRKRLVIEKNAGQTETPPKTVRIVKVSDEA